MGPERAYAAFEKLGTLPELELDDLTATYFGRFTHEHATPQDGVTPQYRDVPAWVLAFDGVTRLETERVARPAGEATAPAEVEPVLVRVDVTIVLDARTGEYLYAVEQGRGRA